MEEGGCVYISILVCVPFLLILCVALSILPVEAFVPPPCPVSSVSMRSWGSRTPTENMGFSIRIFRLPLNFHPTGPRQHDQQLRIQPSLASP